MVPIIYSSQYAKEKQREFEEQELVLLLRH